VGAVTRQSWHRVGPFPFDEATLRPLAWSWPFRLTVTGVPNVWSEDLDGSNAFPALRLRKPKRGDWQYPKPGDQQHRTEQLAFALVRPELWKRQEAFIALAKPERDHGNQLEQALGDGQAATRLASLMSELAKLHVETVDVRAVVVSLDKAKHAALRAHRWRPGVTERQQRWKRTLAAIQDFQQAGGRYREQESRLTRYDRAVTGFLAETQIALAEVRKRLRKAGRPPVTPWREECITRLDTLGVGGRSAKRLLTDLTPRPKS